MGCNYKLVKRFHTANRERLRYGIFRRKSKFSMYTQIAIATSTKMVLPVMADDSSRRAIQNAFSLVYGLKLPSEIYSKYAFAEKLKEVDMPLPKVYMILKNRLTQYMGTASAYATVLQEIDNVETIVTRMSKEL